LGEQLIQSVSETELMQSLVVGLVDNALQMLGQIRHHETPPKEHSSSAGPPWLVAPLQPVICKTFDPEDSDIMNLGMAGVVGLKCVVWEEERNATEDEAAKEKPKLCCIKS